MAKVIGPIQIKGTIDDLNFVVTADGNNYVRLKGKTGVSSESFKNNPVFDRIREQGNEFRYCVKKSKVFRQLAASFNNLAKDGSFAGRVNKLLLEILKEDPHNPSGERTLENALKTTDAKELLVPFESNKLRPLHQVLTTKQLIDPVNRILTLNNFNAARHLNWPEEATHVHLAMATANWDFENDCFDSCYSNAIILDKESEQQTLSLTTDKPAGNELHLTFFFIGFAKQQRKKLEFLHRKHNTATLISYTIP